MRFSSGDPNNPLTFNRTINIDVSNNTEQSTDPTAVVAIYADENVTVKALHGGQLISSSYAVVSNLGATVNLGIDEASGEALDIQGDLGALNGNGATSTINLSLGNGSKWRGRALLNHENPSTNSDGKINLELKNGGKWIVTESSKLSSLDSDDGTIDLSDATKGSLVAIENLTRTGETEVLADDAFSNKIKVTNYTGAGKITVNVDGKINDAYTEEQLNEYLDTVVTDSDDESLVERAQVE